MKVSVNNGQLFLQQPPRKSPGPTMASCPCECHHGGTCKPPETISDQQIKDDYICHNLLHVPDPSPDHHQLLLPPPGGGQLQAQPAPQAAAQDEEHLHLPPANHPAV